MVSKKVYPRVLYRCPICGREGTNTIATGQTEKEWAKKWGYKKKSGQFPAPCDRCWPEWKKKFNEKALQKAKTR